MEKLDRFGTGPFNPSWDLHRALLDAEISLHSDSVNMSAGMYEGMGPRYGMAPIPGHSYNDAAYTLVYSPGLQLAEAAASSGGYLNRRKVLALLPMALGKNSAPATRGTAYVAVLVNSGGYLDILAISDRNGSDISYNIYEGFPENISDVTSTFSSRYFFSELIPSQAGVRIAAAVAEYTSGKYYASVAQISISGADIRMDWYMGNTAGGDATHAPEIALESTDSITGVGGAARVIHCGIPSEFNLQNFSQKERSIIVKTLRSGGTYNVLSYLLTFNPSSTTMKANVVGATATKNLDIDGVAGAVIDGVGANYTTTEAAIINDSECRHNTSYRAVLVAAKKPFAAIFQDSYCASSFHKQQIVDLTKNSYEPLSLAGNAALSYTEDAFRKQSPFVQWPTFTRGTEMAGAIAQVANLGAGDTGVLRANTIYEFTYSLFNKRLGFETNVGTPVKIQVGTGSGAEDFRSLKLFDASSANTNMYQLGATLWNLPFDFSNETSGTLPYTGTSKAINFAQYRFYYREEGTLEWIPALFIDAAEFWFAPHDSISACTGAIGALPGGWPGGTIDYSPLPNDTYDCVVTYKNRAFWLSETAAVFSLQNNIFAYPLLNRILVPSGTFRGAKVTNYPGQAQQSSRLLIGTSEGIFVARFTGARRTAVIQISAESTAPVEVDGSDLEIDPWTSNTWFSHRACADADGICFWWGPDGIFRDAGVEIPSRLSYELEPGIAELYDPSKTDEIHAHYNAQTKEVIWFYPPKVVDSSFPTHAIAYHVEKQQFYPLKFAGKIDWASTVEIKTDCGTAGKRGIVAVRETASATTQRAYFFDQRNRSGDLKPKAEMMVKTISTPATGTRRLTLVGGYDATNFATIVAGDFIAFQRAKEYAGSTITAVSDQVCVVSSTNVGTGAIDVLIPDGASFDATFTALTAADFIPIWHRAKDAAGINGITYRGKTNYWTPNGVTYFAQWLYLFFVFRFVAWKQTRRPTIALSHRTPVSTEAFTSSIELVDNADGYCQILHDFDLGERAAEGQGIQLDVSGFHIGHEWVLESLVAFTDPKDVNALKEFQED